MSADLISQLRIDRVRQSRLPSTDFGNIGFGNTFSDHMFSLTFTDGQWRNPEIVPYGPISVDPGCLTLHYGQSVFEGLKAFRGIDNRVRIFRADMNDERMRNSCDRLCIPRVPTGLFEEAIIELVRMDCDWIPPDRGEALYVRPLIFAEESHLQVRPATRYRFLIMTAPVTTYYDTSAGGVGLRVQDQFTRAAPGGIGFAKTAGNYAASLFPGESSRQDGFDQALWLDGAEHKYVEEVGQMNIFFDIDGTIVTPELRGTILPGVTRDSVITLLRDQGRSVEERRIEIDEIVQASKSGSLNEAFGAGTATVIAPVGRIAYQDETVVINDNQAGPLSAELYDTILGIQLGERPDPYGWTTVVDVNSQASVAD
jgi:branched-chain amino acid aminotransferase